MCPFYEKGLVSYLGSESRLLLTPVIRPNQNGFLGPELSVARPRQREKKNLSPLPESRNEALFMSAYRYILGPIKV